MTHIKLSKKKMWTVVLLEKNEVEDMVDAADVLALPVGMTLKG